MTAMGKWLLRLAVFSVVIVLTALEWVGTNILNFSEMLCRLICGISFVLAVTAYLFGIASLEQALNALISGFLLYLIPRAGKILVTSVAFLHIALTEVIKK